MLVLFAGCGARPAVPLIDLKSGKPAAIINLAWFDYRRDFGGPAAWEQKGVALRRDAVDRRFKELREAGVQGVVWFLLADGGGAVEFDSAGRMVGLTPSFMADFIAGLSIAEQNGLAVVWVLLDHLWMKPAELSSGAQLFGHARLIGYPAEQKTFFERVLDPIIAQGSASASTAGWIVMNEPEVALGEGWVAEGQLFPFLVAASARIKATNPAALVSIGHADLESMQSFQRQHPGIADFLNFHHYRDYPPPAVTDGKLPVYVGEFNVTDPLLGRVTNDMGGAMTAFRGLGYAGAWPWGLKDARIIKEFVQAHSAVTPKRTGNGPPPSQIEKWRTEIAAHYSQVAVNTKKLEDTRLLLTRLEPEFFRQVAEADRARAAVAQVENSLQESRAKISRMNWMPWVRQSLRQEIDNQRQLAQRLPGPRQWLQEAATVQQKTGAEVALQRNWLTTYAMHIRGNQYQIRAKQRAIEFAAATR